MRVQQLDIIPLTVHIYSVAKANEMYIARTVDASD